MSRADHHPSARCSSTARGDAEALGRLLQLYRNYLQIMARSLIGPDLRAHVAPSDVVQETYLEAHRDFARFLGTAEPSS